MKLWSIGRMTANGGRMKCSREKYFSILVACIVFATSNTANTGSNTCPLAPGEPGFLERHLVVREEAIYKERKVAIKLLIEFLAKNKDVELRADALFRLSELYWEDSEAEFLKAMQEYDNALDDFRAEKTKKRPKPPRLDLRKSLDIYEEILEKHSDFQNTDIVLYLYGFGLNEQGDEEAALSIFRVLLNRFPGSSFAADAHLAIGEYNFAKGNFKEALSAYDQVLKYPETLLYDLALYKTAWCYFKTGDAKRAANRFKKVLTRSKEQRQKAVVRVDAKIADLEKEALEDLALTFSESGGAKEAYRFMEQVGGEEYSIKVLHSLGEVFFKQARYDKAIESYQTLLDQFPLAENNPDHQHRIAECYDKTGQNDKALSARQTLAERFGPRSSWSKHHQKNKQLVQDGIDLAEKSLWYVASFKHKNAQKTQKRIDYQAASVAYFDYLEQFDHDPKAPQMHFFLGEVLFKLQKFEKAAKHYAIAAQRAKSVDLKKESSYASILAYDQLRQKEGRPSTPPLKKQEVSKAEQGFHQAVESFAKISPKDKKLPQLRFEVGQIYYHRAYYSQAAEHFLAIVELYPKGKFAEASADLALDCYSKDENWIQLEKQSRTFLESKLFENKELGNKLAGFIVAAIFQNATKLAKDSNHSKAATEYLRLADEFPKDKLAAKALFNAAVNMEASGKKDQALAAYKKIIKKYPNKAAEATFKTAGIFERQYKYNRAATHYLDFAKNFRKDNRAPDAMLQASILYRALKKYLLEARVLKNFTRRFPKHKKASEALFRSCLALLRAEKYKSAVNNLKLYLKKYASKAKRVRVSTLHMAEGLLKLGKRKQASKKLKICANYHPKTSLSSSELTAAAHCRFLLAEMVFDEYTKIKLRPPKKRLVKLLNKKAALLKKAERLFTNVVATGDMEWASAALYRIGDMYAQFAQAIYNAPLPRGLDSEEKEVYRQELQSLAFPIEDKALTAFTISHSTSLKHGYFSQWSKKTVEMLRKLDPGQFPKEEEIRPATKWADSITTFPLILSKLPVPAPVKLEDDQKRGAK
jgi:TolA-binding protein